MEKKYVFFVVVLIINLLFSGCKAQSTVDSDEIIEKIEKLENENTELQLQISALEEVIEVRNNELALLKQLENYTILEKTIFHGYGQVVEETDMKIVPNITANSCCVLKPGDTVEIIDEYKTGDGTQWLLVKFNEQRIHGYIETDKIEMLDIPHYYQSAEWDISGFRIGESISNAIHFLGNAYTQIEPTEYRYNETAIFDNNNYQTEIQYNPVTKVIERIHTNDVSITVNGLFSVGENVYDSANMLKDIFIDNKEHTYVLLEDGSGYYLILYYDDNYNISSIVYRTCEIEA